MTPIRSFGRYQAGESIVRHANSVDEIRKVFAEARESKRRVAIRAGGHSFHDQALHDKDTGSSIVLFVGDFQRDLIEFVPGQDQVRLGTGVRWGDYFREALKVVSGEPLLIPASMQTGRKATVGGTLSGDCLSRFSGTMGKESRSIVSFRLLTTTGTILDVSEDKDPDLFHSVIGGHGYLGFVLEATYCLVPVAMPSAAFTAISLHDSFTELVQRQLEIVKQNDGKMRAVSSAWFTDLHGIDGPNRIKGAVFESWFDAPTVPPKAGFPLYDDIESPWRYATELLARTEPANTFAHEFLYLLAKHHQGDFENSLTDFMFFMDGNTVAKEKFEESTGQLFPIIQQTFVIPPDATAQFAENCEHKMRSYSIRPTEADMLYVKADECLMSGNYHLDGFAVSFGFEPIKTQPPPRILELLDDLTEDCLAFGGRLHLVKNAYAQPTKLRRMFSPQIEKFEEIKRKHDPSLILQNTFSDRLFKFSTK